MEPGMMKITLEQWRVFVATARYGSFHQAAERLSKTQSAVSHAVRKMEESLGKDLFAIEGRRATLTKAGQMTKRIASANEALMRVAAETVGA